MKKNSVGQLLFLLFWLVGTSLVAQNTDIGCWTGVEMSKKLDNGLKLIVGEEYRLRNELKTTDKFESSIGLEYGFCKYVDAGVSYSMINYFHPRDDNHDHNYFELRHRFNAYGEGEYIIGRFDLTLRERVQGTYRVLDSLSSAKVNPKYVLRSKMSVSYNIKGLPLDPFAFVELFNPLEQGSNGMQISSYRWSMGLKYAFNKKLSVKLGYLFTSDVDSDEADRSNVLTVGLGYKL